MLSFFKPKIKAVPPRITARRSAPSGEGVVPRLPAIQPPQINEEPPSVSSNLFNTTLDGQQFV